MLKQALTKQFNIVHQESAAIIQMSTALKELPVETVIQVEQTLHICQMKFEALAMLLSLKFTPFK